MLIAPTFLFCNSGESGLKCEYGSAGRLRFDSPIFCTLRSIPDMKPFSREHLEHLLAQAVAQGADEPEALLAARMFQRVLDGPQFDLISDKFRDALSDHALAIIDDDDVERIRCANRLTAIILSKSACISVCIN